MTLYLFVNISILFYFTVYDCYQSGATDYRIIKMNFHHSTLNHQRELLIPTIVLLVIVMQVSYFGKSCQCLGHR